MADQENEVEQEQEQLPNNAWGLAGFVVKKLGDNASAILVAAGVVAALYFFIEQRNKFDKEKDEAVRRATQEAYELRDKAMKTLTTTYDSVSDQRTKQMAEISTVMELHEEISTSVVQQLRKLREAEQARQEAEAGKKKAEEAKKQTTQRVESWSNLLRLAVLGGELVTATSKEQAAKLTSDMESLYLSDDADGEFNNTIMRIRKEVEQWEVGQKEASQNVKNEVLTLGGLARKSFNNGPQILKGMKIELEAILYKEAIDVTQRLATAKDFEAAEEDRREFWSLYYGRLVFVESEQVEEAMVDFSSNLQAWEAIDKEDESALKDNLKQRNDFAQDLKKQCDATVELHRQQFRSAQRS